MKQALASFREASDAGVIDPCESALDCGIEILGEAGVAFALHSEAATALFAAGSCMHLLAGIRNPN